jgi:hypothetical protein
MNLYETIDREFIHASLAREISLGVEGAQSFESVAQHLTNFLYDHLKSSVLVRFYGTCSFGQLPQENQLFARNLATSANVQDLITDRTPVLNLLSTRGRLPDWNNRRRSKGHVSIPLVSSKFVQAIPMIARVLHEFGLGTEWLNQRDATSLIVKSMGRSGAVFFVPDATTFRDQAGRLVIPAQDFVSSHQVRSVFGVGGAYPDGKIILFLCFTTETLDRRTAEKFLPAINMIKAQTISMMTKGLLFS